MKVVTTAALAGLLALSASSLAQVRSVREEFGNAPVANQPGWDEGLVAVVNLDSRVYSFRHAGNEHHYFKGDPLALNQAMKAYAKVKAAERRLVLLPGRGTNWR